MPKKRYTNICNGGRDERATCDGISDKFYRSFEVFFWERITVNKT